MSKLSEVVKLKQRYVRSINLERDLDDIESVQGYIPTSRSIEALNRFFRAYSTPNTVRAWTVTSVYGTGKSAFANFLTTLCADSSSAARKEALKSLKVKGLLEQDNWLSFQDALPEKGLLRAVTAAQREPIANTVIRALYNGAIRYWRIGKKPDVLSRIEKLYQESIDNPILENSQILKLLSDVAGKTQGGVLLIIDELGKNLEYITDHQAEADLYLLQQIAELPTGENAPKILTLGLLHQSFAGYSSRLNSIQKNEWTKIQGRFEDISFTESTEQVVNLITQALDHSSDKSFQKEVKGWEEAWISNLSSLDSTLRWSKGQLLKIYPLHPLSVQILPALCQKYAQNDRSLFTFLTGSEPFSLSSFIQIHHLILSNKKGSLSSLKLHDVYDYFVESVGITSQPKYSRWIEIQSRILEASRQSSDEIKVLKTIGVLNLVSNPKASMEVVILAMCNNPDLVDERDYWKRIIDSLLKKSFVTWRERIDEIRIWEGSDFDVEEAVKFEIERLGKTSIANILNKIYPLRPVVAQRHSYQTGTLRYFECQYVDLGTDMDRISCQDSTSDGKILYWVEPHELISGIPQTTIEGKPVVFISSENIEAFQQALLDYTALKKVTTETTQLTSDGVARKEVRHRLIASKRLLDQLFQKTYDVSSPSVFCQINREIKSFNSESQFNFELSEVLNNTYQKGLLFWNELINRRKLSSNAVKARRELMEAMLRYEAEENLGLKGYGPEVSIYRSLLLTSGIHHEANGKWQFTDPYPDSGIADVWHEIENYLTQAVDSTKPLNVLIETLQAVPYGVKEGLLPILITAVLLKHSDDIGLYYKDKYLPTIEPEQLDFLTRFPDRFAIKYFKIEGIQAEFFKAIEEVFESSTLKNERLRNTTLLGIVSPLIKFVKSLPQYTLQTKELSGGAISIREAVLKMTEPDQMLFVDLPVACGFERIDKDAHDKRDVKAFKAKLIQGLLELQNAYSILLEKCQNKLYDGLKVVGDKKSIRENLRVRANHLYGKVIEKKVSSFVRAAVDAKSVNQQWLESLVMVIADKPARSWKDEDFLKFEINLTDLARRFKNIEAIQSELVSTQHEGFDALRVTLTKSNGNEINKMVWLDHAMKREVESMADKFFEDSTISEDEDIQKALIAAIIQRIFNKEEKEKSKTKLVKMDKKIG
jgi:hypothetical protein